jgi:hypothetical protein
MSALSTPKIDYPSLPTVASAPTLWPGLYALNPDDSREWMAGVGRRRARTRGLARITTDFDTRAAALNWARLAILSLSYGHTNWKLPAT